MINLNECFNNETFFPWIDDKCFRFETATKVRRSKELRGDISITELSHILKISRKKLYEIESGVCKDFNSINNYINFFMK